MAKKTIVVTILLLVLTLFPTSAWCEDELAPSATRNSDNTITIRWNKDYNDGKDEIKIYYKWPNNFSYIYEATVPISEGFYVHETISDFLNSTINYKIKKGITYEYKFDAEPYQEKPEDDHGNPLDPPNNGNEKGSGNTTGPIKDKGGMFERAVAGLINALVSVIESLQTVGKLKPMEELIFNNIESGPFNNHEWDLLSAWYMGVSSFVMILALVAVVATSFKMMAAAMNPLLRSEAVGSMWRWFLALFIIAAAPLFVWLCFEFNNWLVSGFVWVSEKVMTDRSTLGYFSMDSEFIQSIKTGSILGTAIVKLAFAGLNLYLNILYIVRFYVLVVLFVFAPLMAWMWALNKNVHASTVWVGEVISNTFMQASHALTILVFLTFTDKGTMGDNWLTLLIGLLVILPITEMLRNSMQGLFARFAGVNEEKWAGRAMLGMTGLGAIAGLGNVGKATLGGFTGGTVTPGFGPSSGPGSGGMTGTAQPSHGMATASPASFHPGGSIGNSARNSATMGSTTYTQNPAGILVPGINSANNTTNQNNNQGQNMGKVPGIAKSASGQVSNNFGRKIGGAVGGAMGATMLGRGGEKFVSGGAAIGGAMARGITSSVKLGKEVHSQVKQGHTVGEAMKNITGGQSTAKSIGRAASFVGTQTFSPYQTSNLVNNWVTKDNPDGFRYR